MLHLPPVSRLSCLVCYLICANIHPTNTAALRATLAVRRLYVGDTGIGLFVSYYESFRHMLQEILI